MPKSNDDYDDLFDAWGRALNVDPQFTKTIFHVESSGNPNTPDGPLSPNAPIGPDGRPEQAEGGMQMMPSTARAMAIKLGFNPNAINLHDMRWAVPLATQYIADGMNATQSAEGAAAYYFSGSADPANWGDKTQSYIGNVRKLYPTMALTPAPPTQSAPVQTAAAAAPSGQ